MPEPKATTSTKTTATTATAATSAKGLLPLSQSLVLPSPRGMSLSCHPLHPQVPYQLCPFA